MTRLHYLTREVGYSKREAREILHSYDKVFSRGDKTIAKIQRAERVRHCTFLMPVREGGPF